jgi:hypothetical protein
MNSDIPIGIVALIAALAFTVPVALIALPARLEVRRSTAAILPTE